MDWVHCNNCAAKPAQNKLYLTMCGHVLCHSCCERAKDKQCHVCKKPLKATEINKNLRPDLMTLFKDPMKILADGMTQLKQTATFQAKQREIFVKFRNLEAKQESDSFNETRMAYMKISQEMERRKTALSEDNERLKKEKEQNKLLIERRNSLKREASIRPASSMPYSSSHISVIRSKTEPMPSKNSRFLVPITRRISREMDQSTSKIVTSTPIANIDFSRRDFMNRMFGAGHANPSPIPRL